MVEFAAELGYTANQNHVRQAPPLLQVLAVSQRLVFTGTKPCPPAVCGHTHGGGFGGDIKGSEMVVLTPISRHTADKNHVRQVPPLLHALAVSQMLVFTDTKPYPPVLCGHTHGGGFSGGSKGG